MKKVIITVVAFVCSLCVNAQSQQTTLDSTARSLEKEGLYLFEREKYDEASTRYESAANMRQSMNIAQDTSYVRDMVFHAKCCYRTRKIKEAILRAQKVVDYYGTNISNSDEKYAFYIDNLALYQSTDGNFADAEAHSREAVNIYEKLMKNDNDLAIMLEHLAENCDGNGKHAEAIKHELRALNILKTVYGEHSDNYLSEVVYLKEYYENNGNKDKADRLQENIDRLTKEKDSSKIMFAEMFGTPERCHTYNPSVLSVAKQYLDCDLQKANINGVADVLMEWSATSSDICIDVDSTVTSFMKEKKDVLLFLAFMAAVTEHNLENNIKRIDVDGMKQVKLRVEDFYKRNKETFGRRPEIEKWFKI